MFNQLNPQARPLPVAIEVLRAGLLNQSAITQRHLSTVGYLVRTAGAQARNGLTGTGADPLIAQQTLALTSLTDSVVGMTRVISDLHVRSASELLRWWETQLRALTPWDEDAADGGADSDAEPVPAATALSAPTPARPARKRAADLTGRQGSSATAKPKAASKGSAAAGRKSATQERAASGTAKSRAKAGAKGASPTASKSRANAAGKSAASATTKVRKSMAAGGRKTARRS